MPSPVAAHMPGPVERAAILHACLDAYPYVTLAVSGRCMEPALPEGSRVGIIRRPSRFGDVVLVRHPEGLRLHRLIWRPPLGGWRTKGDRSLFVDPAIGRADIFGVAATRATRWQDIVSALRSLAATIARSVRR